MQKLKLTAPIDDKPVKLTIELPAQVHRDLVAYADVLGHETTQTIEPAKLIAPMLARFRAPIVCSRRYGGNEPQIHARALSRLTKTISKVSTDKTGSRTELEAPH